MITYTLILSERFPATHPRHGEPTDFKHKFIRAMACRRMSSEDLKLHTIRANPWLWVRRFEQINAGKACLSVRMWSGKPYASKQEELWRLTKADGIGMQLLYLPVEDSGFCYVLNSMHSIQTKAVDPEIVANHDGLLLQDWRPWFQSHNPSEPLAIIHFTNFRY